MSEKKKKLFPKLKKKLQDFLTDESGEITKKDALGIAAGASILASVESVNADTIKEKKMGYDGWTGDGKCTFYGEASTTVKAKHVSGIINGHISKNPEVTIKMSTKTLHSSHGSHGSHGQW